MLGRVIEWMYPTVCPVCQKVLGKGKIICDTCKDELHIIYEPRCAKCGNESCFIQIFIWNFE